MRILIASHAYTPHVGGTEVVGEVLASEFAQAGHDVKVVTQTLAEGHADSGAVIRRPGLLKLAQLVRWSDVVVHNSISLRMAWPLLLFPRPWVVGHQTWLTRANGRIAWQDRVKHAVLRFAVHIAASRALAEALPVSCAVVGNPYRDDVFAEDCDATKLRDLVFVGRLVSDKGADILLDALDRVAAHGLRPTLTIVGSGPEEQPLRRLAEQKHLSAQIEFAGALGGSDLATTLNAHRILVVPSRWNEPFGIVALEAIACGCVVIGSSGGGLRDAIGDCGVTVENGNAAALAAAIEQVLSNPEAPLKFRAAASRHLAKYRRKEVASAYLQVIASAVRHRTPKTYAAS